MTSIKVKHHLEFFRRLMKAGANIKLDILLLVASDAFDQGCYTFGAEQEGT